MAPVTPTATAAAPKSLASKLAEIVKLVERVAKRGRNDFHKYDYATEADVLEAVRGGLADRNLMIVPRVVGEHVTEVTRQGKDARFITRVDMVFTIIDGDSDAVLECPWKGWGEDSGDKGGYKAITGADKYFLLKLFLLPTGDDPEREKVKGKSRKADQRPDQTDQRAEEPAGRDMSPEARAILAAAGELSQHLGTIDPQTLIKEASKFTGRDGKEKFFTDPTAIDSAKWLKGTLDRLQKDLHKERAHREPGAAEAASLFDSTPV